MTGTDALVRAVLSSTLRDEGRAAPAWVLEGDDWSALRHRMFAGNVPGLLAYAVESRCVVVDESAREELVDAIIVRMVNDLRAESECVRVVDILTAVGIESVVLKGLAVAHLDYIDPSHRSTNDVDLLVRSDDIEQTTAVLTDAGYRRDLPERRRGFDRRFAKDVTFYGPRKVEVDVHRTLLRGPFGAAIDLDELWENQQPLAVDGLPTRRALDKPSRLLHAAYSVAVADSRPTLANLCDVALLAADPEMDWDHVRQRAVRWRAAGLVEDAVLAAREATGLDLPAPSLMGGPNRSAHHWRSLYTSGGGSLVSTTVGTTRALGIFAAVRYLRDLAFPGRAYVRARRQAGRRSEFRAAVDAIRARYGRSSG